MLLNKNTIIISSSIASIGLSFTVGYLYGFYLKKKKYYSFVINEKNETIDKLSNICFDLKQYINDNDIIQLIENKQKNTEQLIHLNLLNNELKEINSNLQSKLSNLQKAFANLEYESNETKEKYFKCSIEYQNELNKLKEQYNIPLNINNKDEKEEQFEESKSH